MKEQSKMAITPTECRWAEPSEPLNLVLTQLPADSKLAAAGVCRAWRAVLAQHWLWRELDFSAVAYANETLLRTCCARAGGELHHLDVSGCSLLLKRFAAEREASVLFAVVRGAGRHLRTLRVQGEPLPAPAWAALLAAAPHITQLHACLALAPGEQPPLKHAVLRVRGLRAVCSPHLLQLAVDHAPLEELELDDVHLDDPAHLAGLEGLTDCRGCLRALRLTVTAVGEAHERWPQALCAVLAGCPALRQLHVTGTDFSLFPRLGQPSALFDALVGSRLHSLSLSKVRLADWPHAGELLRRLVGHPTLSALDLSGSTWEPRRAEAAGWLAALLSAHTPGLSALDVSDCKLRDEGVRPLLAALHGHPRLRELRLGGNKLSSACVSDAIFPAVRAAPALRLLEVKEPTELSRRVEEHVARARCSGLAEAAQLPPQPVFGLLLSMSDFEKQERLGRGAFGLVYRAHSLLMNQTVALKRVDEREGAGLPVAIAREVALLALLDHANIVGFYGAAMNATGTLYIAMQFAQRSLSDALRSPEGVPPARRAAILAQVAAGLAYAHSRRVLHRDLTPSNILLLEPEGRVLISDFGLSRRWLDSYQSAAEESAAGGGWTPLVVTLWYRSPELLRAERYGEGVDTWALGCIAAELLRGGRALLPGRTELEQLSLIEAMLAAGEPALRGALRDARASLAAPEPLASVALGLLRADAGARMSAAEAAAVLTPFAPPLPGRGDSRLPRTRYLSDAELAASPSRRDGLREEEEAAHRWVMASFIYSVAAEALPASVAAAVADTAVVYSLRFFCAHPFGRRQHASHAVGCAALLLASKVVHSPLRPEQLARLSYRKRYANPDDYPRVAGRLQASILEEEWRLALVLGFALFVRPPRLFYLHIRGAHLVADRSFGQLSVAGAEAALLHASQLALAAMHTHLPLQHSGGVLASCCLALAARRALSCGLGSDDALCAAAASSLDADAPATGVVAKVEGALVWYLGNVARDVRALARLTGEAEETVAARMEGRPPRPRASPSPAHHLLSPVFWPTPR